MEKEMKRKTHKDFDLSQFGDDKQAAMAKMYEDTLKNFKEGSIVPGKVVEVRNNEVLVDIGYKSEGLIAGEEFRDLATTLFYRISPGLPTRSDRSETHPQASLISS